MMRLVLLAAAAAMAAVITSSLGLIGMIGLAGPNLARTFAPGQDGRRLLWSTLLGALLLVGIDQLLRAVAPFIGNIPRVPLQAFHRPNSCHSGKPRSSACCAFNAGNHPGERADQETASPAFSAFMRSCPLHDHIGVGVENT